MSAKILVWDLETSQSHAKTWGPKWNTNLNSITEDQIIYMVGYEWLGDGNGPQVKSQLDFSRAYGRNRRDDRQLTEFVAGLVDEADVVVGQNIDKFDMRVLTARMLNHRIRKLAPTPSVDIVKYTRKHFRLHSYKLDDVARFLGIPGKRSHAGLALWDAVDEADPEAWQEMIDYCLRDTALTTEVYYLLRDNGWLDRHPNISLLTGANGVCPTCGSAHLHKRGTHRALTRTYQKYQCQNCGSYSRSVKIGDEDVRADMRPI